MSLKICVAQSSLFVNENIIDGNENIINPDGINKNLGTKPAKNVHDSH